MSRSEHEKKLNLAKRITPQSEWVILYRRLEIIPFSKVAKEFTNNRELQKLQKKIVRRLKNRSPILRKLKGIPNTPSWWRVALDIYEELREKMYRRK